MIGDNTICIGMLVKNEINYIQYCLDSIYKYLD